MKLVIQRHVDRNPSLLLSPEGHAEMLQLSEVKRLVLELKIDHWDSDSNNLKNWNDIENWGFNLPLVLESELDRVKKLEQATIQVAMERNARDKTINELKEQLASANRKLAEIRATIS